MKPVSVQVALTTCARNVDRDVVLMANVGIEKHCARVAGDATGADHSPSGVSLLAALVGGGWDNVSHGKNNTLFR
jgi:hypothetical protein